MRWMPIAIAIGVLATGCTKTPSALTVGGTVACGSQIATAGRVTFVPIDGVGRTCAANIANGKYRIEANGGVPFGKYRVEVDAKTKTGRKVAGNNGVETTMIDEVARLGSAIYAGDKSPLTVEINAESSTAYDISLPAQ